MNKQIIITLLILIHCQLAFSQSYSLKFGLKGKIIRALENDPNSPSTFYAGLKGDSLGTGLVYKSNDFGKTWHHLNNGLPISPYISDIQSISVSKGSQKTIYVGTWKNGLHKSTDKGKSWEKDFTFPSSDIRSIKAGVQTPSLVYAATSNFGVVKSLDEGKTWKRCSPKTIDTTFKFAWSIALDNKNDSIVYAQTFNQGVWKSIDQGETWKQILDTKGLTCWDMKISENSNKIWVASSKSGDTLSAVYNSIDKGNTWTEISNIPQIGVNQINVVEHDNKETLIIGSWKDGVYTFQNDNWIKNNTIDFSAISEILINNTGLLIGSWGNGIYHLKIEGDADKTKHNKK